MIQKSTFQYRKYKDSFNNPTFVPTSIQQIINNYFILKAESNDGTYWKDKSYYLYDSIANTMTYLDTFLNQDALYQVRKFGNFLFLWNISEDVSQLHIFKQEDNMLRRQETKIFSEMNIFFIEVPRNKNLIGQLTINNSYRENLHVTYFSNANNQCTQQKIDAYQNPFGLQFDKMFKIKDAPNQYLIDQYITSIKLTSTKMKMKVLKKIDTSLFDFFDYNLLDLIQDRDYYNQLVYAIDQKKKILTSFFQVQKDSKIYLNTQFIKFIHYEKQKNPYVLLNLGNQVLLFNHMNNETLEKTDLTPMTDFGNTVVIKRHNDLISSAKGNQGRSKISKFLGWFSTKSNQAKKEAARKARISYDVVVVSKNKDIIRLKLDIDLG